MNPSLSQVEELLTDESFLAWYFKTNPVDMAAWDKRLAGNPEQQKLADEAVELLKALSLKEQPVDSGRVNGAEQRLMQKINGPAVTPVVAIRRRRPVWWAAAAAIFIFVAGWSGWQYYNQRGISALTTKFGEIRNEVLPDGSMVTLNANTEIKYKTSADREVWIEGEAFFTVQKTDEKRRFIVHTGNFDVIVTGTQFNVTNRSNLNSVLLREGSITVRSAGGKELQMKPGEYMAYVNEQFQRKYISDTPVIAWKERKFIFEKTPMRDVASSITEVYGIKVTLAGDAVASTPVSGIFPNDNLDIFLNSLEVSQNFEIERTEQEILIRKK
jgi:transmembrane sensor